MRRYLISEDGSGDGTMAVGKRLRFEIFKRDSFTCQYCGQFPPHVILEVDHLTPRASGGSDDIENLVTSCFACNRGKCDVAIGFRPPHVRRKPEPLGKGIFWKPDPSGDPAVLIARSIIDEPIFRDSKQFAKWLTAVLETIPSVS